MGVMAKANKNMQNAWCEELHRAGLTIRQVTQSVSEDNLEYFKQIMKKATAGQTLTSVEYKKIIYTIFEGQRFSVHDTERIEKPAALP